MVNYVKLEISLHEPQDAQTVEEVKTRVRQALEDEFQFDHASDIDIELIESAGSAA